MRRISARVVFPAVIGHKKSRPVYSGRHPISVVLAPVSPDITGGCLPAHWL